VNTEEVTRQIMSAWDEVQDEEDAAVENDERELPDDQDDQAEEEQEGAEDGEQEAEQEEVAPGDADGDEEAAAEEEEGEEEEEQEVQAQFEDPEVQAFLAKYGGDVERALKAEAHQQRIIGQLGSDKQYLSRRVQELEAELAQQSALSGMGVSLDSDQAAWVEEAVESGNPQMYVQNALRVGEFDLARAVCDAWAQEQPYQAIQARQLVDHAHQRAFHAAQEAEGANGAVALPTETILGVLVNHYPDMPRYEQQMITTMGNLGPEHPLVEQAHSSDPEVQAYAILGIYEIARAQTATVTSSRDAVKAQRREEAAGAKRRAKVSSSQATPSPGETPRPRRLGPGLTLEQLDAEWERE